MGSSWASPGTTGRRLTLLAMLAVLLVLASGGGEAALAQGKVVKIGVLLPLTGNFGGTGKSISDGVQWLAEEVINAGGGIKALGGAKIKIVRADTTSEAKVALGEMDKLLSVEKPALVIGPYATGEANSAAPLLEKYKVPGLGVRTTGDPIFPLELRYWRTIAVPSKEYGASFSRHVLALKKEFGIKTDRIVILGGDASWWRDYGRLGAREVLEKAGLGSSIVGDMLYDPRAKDFGPVIAKVKALNPDVLIHGSYFEEGILIHKARHALDFFPPVIVATDSAYVTPKVADAIGIDMARATVMGKGVFGDGYWSSAVPIKSSQELVARATKWAAPKKIEVDVDFMMGVQAMTLARRALEAAGDADPQRINDAFHKMEVKLGDPDFLIPAFAPAIAWEPNGRPKHADWVTYQWKDKDSWVVIYPKELRTGTPLFK
jgi:branched-chain amino acid transport system substrate-binding protein